MDPAVNFKFEIRESLAITRWLAADALTYISFRGRHSGRLLSQSRMLCCINIRFAVYELCLDTVVLISAISTRGPGPNDRLPCIAEVLRWDEIVHAVCLALHDYETFAHLLK